MSPFRGTWWLEPRDPLVFGTGARSAAFQPPFGALLPPQATAAGLVRSTLAGGGTRVSREEAQTLLSVAIRGPWLAQGNPDGYRLWVPVPADLVLSGEEGETRWLRGRLGRAAAGEGVSQPPELESVPALLNFLRSRDSQGRKTRRPRFPYRPFDWLVGWSLRDDEEGPWWNEGESPLLSDPVRRESRVHVGIDDETLTAEPEALFSSAGLRFAEGFELAIEVAEPSESDLGEAGVPPLLLLGGEARVSRARWTQGGCFPPFSRWEDEIARRITALEASAGNSTALGLRLQLLSPGAFGGWRPANWPEEIEGLPLASVVVPGFDAVSGWDLQRNAPRPVRRLVPAGSLFTFGPVASGEVLLDLCRSLWGTSLCRGLPGAAEELLAAPAHDGYGTVLPLPCALPQETSSP